MPSPRFYEYNYTPVLDLFDSDFVDLRINCKHYVPFGEDNNLPRQLIKLAREVPVHRAILNSKTSYISGQGIQSTDAATLRFLEHPNHSRESLANTLKKLVFDYLTFGNCYYELVTNRKQTFIYLYHQDATHVRLHVDGKFAMVHPCWDLYRGHKDPCLRMISLFPEVSRAQDGLYHSLVHLKDYEPEFSFYGIPSYFAGVRDIIISGLTSVWNQTRLESSFAAAGLLIIPGVNSEESAEELDKMFGEYKGAFGSKASEIIIQYLSDLAPGISAQEAKFIAFEKQIEGNWLNLHRQAELSLITIHNWFKSLTPYSDEKSTFDAGRILNEYEIAMATVIRPIQETFTQSLQTTLTSLGLEVKDFEIINKPPVSRINPLKYVWEARRDFGLDYNPHDPIQQLFVLQLKNQYTSSDILTI
jgi:hypothetical protein